MDIRRSDVCSKSQNPRRYEYRTCPNCERLGIAKEHDYLEIHYNYKYFARKLQGFSLEMNGDIS